MYKLKSSGVCGNYDGLLHSFLSDRHQRVVPNSQSSNWSHIKAGVPQDSILGPLLFLVYVNDLHEGLKTSAKLFVDDTSFFQLFTILQYLQHFLMMTYWKFLDGLISGRWDLTKMPQNRRKRLFSLVKQAQLTKELFF